MTHLYKFLVEQSKRHPAAMVEIVRPLHLRMIVSANDLISDMEVNYRYKEKLNLRVAEYEFKTGNYLRVWLNEDK